MEDQQVEELESIDVTLPVQWGHIAGRWYGSRKVRPILALHGWQDNMGTWNNLLPLLPKHIGVLCIDMPGHGLSSKLPKGIIYHAVHYICVILQIMEAYEWKKVSLLAHSMSGRLSFAFTAIYPHLVDLVVSIDVVRTNYFKPNESIKLLRARFEKYIIEDDRLENGGNSEPPSYTLEQLKHVLHEGSGRSVELENCIHILERNITKSKLYPNKYYFSRDGRVKYYFEFLTSDSLVAELANRIRNVPYCVIKGTKSKFINDDSEEVLAILREKNPHFEFHEVAGTHHVHLNNAADVAAILRPFICKHRPPLIESWPLDDSSRERRRNRNSGKQKAQSGLFKMKCKL